MNREHYLWCLVDRYLSMGHFSYTEAFECARRDIYEIPNNRESLEALVKHYGLNVDVEKVEQEFLQNAGHLIKKRIE